MRVVFARHCETDWNAQRRIQGKTDIPLNDVGREQAKQLAKELAQFHITKIFCSTLSRAVETAMLVKKAISQKIEIIPDQRLEECCFGKLEGMTDDEIDRRYKVDFRKQLYPDAEFPYKFSLYGGEDREEVLARHQDFLESLKAGYQGERPLVIGHGAGLNTLLSEFGHEPNLSRGEYRVRDF